MKKCNAKVCTQCEAPFQPSRGCKIEKRCAGCIFLYPRGDLRSHENIISNPRSFQEVFWDSWSQAKREIVERYVDPISVSYDTNQDPFIGSEEDADIDLLDDLRNQIDKVLDQLNEREKAVIRMRFGLLEDKSDRTLEEIGKELSISRERVLQIESSAIKKLKHPKVGRKLKEYITGRFIENLSVSTHQHENEIDSSLNISNVDLETLMIEMGQGVAHNAPPVKYVLQKAIKRGISPHIIHTFRDKTS